GGRVVAVGTSAVRALEASAAAGGEFSSRCGWTDILIGPRHSFLWVDGLITNFHFPRSSPLLLTASFAGRELLLRAYQEASESGYRFYSYGDSMLIL
ncbi:MAG: S-adenosylmethionine:tRNA ribosyltransferase-isomerase, partial [Elusimicrobia bacterium]|nr:S-adenosylmethionine:tRNA ribosyltransferase-isomerase [Elusimicrobiota bacterium]